MFSIKSVELNNFRSFKGTHRWALKDASGLYFLTGINNDNSRLGRNGAGKSSLLDAISWCLYERTTRDLRAGDIINWGANSCYAIVNLDVGQENLTIKRTQSPNLLTVNGHTTDQKSLIKKLRLNHESFLYSVIIPQFGDAFFDLKPAEKLTLFSQIMDLEYWLEKSEKAKKLADEIKLKKQSYENDLFKLNGRLLSIASTITELQIKSKEWADNQVARIGKVKLSIDKQLKSIKDYTLQIKELDEIISGLSPDTKSYEKEVIKQNKIISNFDIELAEVGKELSVVEHQIVTVLEAQKRFERVGAVCSNCKQKVDANHLLNETNKLKRALKDHQTLKTGLVMAKDQIQGEKSQAIISISKIEAELSKIKTKEVRAKGNRDSFLSEIKFTEREITKLESEVEQIRGQKNEFSDLLKSKQEEHKDIGRKIDAKEVDIARLNEEHATVDYWVGGFKKLRLFIIEEVLRTLEIEVNNNLAALGMADWKIQFDVERENKSGGITKGFTVLISDPSDQIVKYESLSGGEGQRVRLAGCFGLANLIMERAGLDSKIEFYDEISQHMSSEGIEDTLNCLKHRADNQGKQIWVVDHHSMSYPDFNGTLTITKDEKGSKIGLTA